MGRNGTPTGTVTFYDGSTELGSAGLTGGSASFTASSMPVGTDSITAVYSGDANFSTSTSAALAQTVEQDGTTTGVASSANPSVYGQSVTFTATISALSPGSGTPTGTMTFYDGSAALGSDTLSGGSASFTTSTLPQGSDSITAIYGGDSNFESSTSAAIVETVNPAATSTSIDCGPSPSVYGQEVTFGAQVINASAPASTAEPTGSVQFYVDGAAFGAPVTLNDEGAALITDSTLPVGTHQITATYISDDGNFATSNSTTPAEQVVMQDSTTTGLTSSDNPSVFGQSVTFTATVSANAPGSGTPTGSVTFEDGTTTLGTGTLSGGVATFSTTSLSVATHSITAVYGGDGNFTTSTSSIVSQTVNQASTATTLTASPARCMQDRILGGS